MRATNKLFRAMTNLVLKWRITNQKAPFTMFKKSLTKSNQMTLLKDCKFDIMPHQVLKN